MHPLSKPVAQIGLQLISFHQCCFWGTLGGPSGCARRPARPSAAFLPLAEAIGGPPARTIVQPDASFCVVSRSAALARSAFPKSDKESEHPVIRPHSPGIINFTSVGSVKSPQLQGGPRLHAIARRMILVGPKRWSAAHLCTGNALICSLRA